MEDHWILRRREDEEGYPRKTFNDPDSENYESQFLRDKARIIHSSAFRRLQSKTQVFSLGDSDFYRTRLTHTLEVAQIGASIASQLRFSGHRDQISTLIPSNSLIEAICLAHDLGHPPYGHGGEYSLNKFMYQDGGFEGNGQTLRIVCRLGEFSEQHGLDLTRRTLLGLLKYPATHSQVANYDQVQANHSDTSSKLALYKPPKCIHDDDAELLEWIIEPFSESDRAILTELRPNPSGHTKTIRKSFDTSIMELADDIAYGVHDLEDAIAMGLVSEKIWEAEVMEQLPNHAGTELADIITRYTEKLFSGSHKQLKHGISNIVGGLIRDIEIRDLESGEHELIRFNACLTADSAAILNILKNFVFKHVIKQRQNQILELKGQMIVEKLFEAILENPERLLKPDEFASFKATGSKRILSDYVSGMTDVYASRLYSNLFLPQSGSLFDQL
ncbi:dNTP triphosphohydrolase [Gimesia benthica]|uniref:Deoxyguanosinetriphosphate triphosphohydrolase-like protein n=1 Tax=Gimesia benthica TaxID=2608982 RepID=A0A6I6AHG1_9PLAN|nr:anti-phage deoxyguanosine triphosphatase [Gimesia benthica]QGQ26113.1 dNTP triphosphohydrolase [Gimesia benthica]